MDKSPISLGKKAYVSESLRLRIHDAILRRFIELEASEKITPGDLARRIGCSTAQVTRFLSGKRNMDLKTLAVFLFAMDAVLDVTVSTIKHDYWR